MTDFPRLKTGLLLPDNTRLRNHHFNLVRHAITHPLMELCVILQEGSDRKENMPNEYGFCGDKAGFLRKKLFLTQLKIESRLCKEWGKVIPEEVMKEIAGIERVTIPSGAEDPDMKNLIFQKIRPMGLDVIIAMDNSCFSSEWAVLAKLGIWQLQFGENLKPGTGPSGFSEIVTRRPFCTVSLLQFCHNSEPPLLLDQGYYNRDWFFLKSFYDVRLGALDLLFKNIEQTISHPDRSFLPVATNQKAGFPEMKYFLKYMALFYWRLWREAMYKPLYTFFKFRKECWSLFLGQGDFFKADLSKLEPQTMPKNEFWADPFLYLKEGKLYIFFENYSYEKKIAKISVGQIENGQIQDVRDTLVKDYHLSYPHLVEEDGNLFLIPETGRNVRMEVYKCLEFPDKWELYSTGFEGENIGDTTYFRDGNGDRWLFLNKGKSKNSELYIYKIDNLKLEKVIPHALNPVYIDCRRARNAGSIYQYGNDYYRPNQRSLDGIYGKELAVNKIKKLTLYEFEEELVRVIEPNFKKGLQAVHTLNQTGGFFVVDGCYTLKG